MKKINIFFGIKPRIHSNIRGGEPEYHNKKGERELDTGRGPNIYKKRSRFVPKGIDPAYPNRNFVKMSYDNKGDTEGWHEYMYGSFHAEPVRQKAHTYGHQHKLGPLRLSGHKGAHRIGRR